MLGSELIEISHWILLADGGKLCVRNVGSPILFVALSPKTVPMDCRLLFKGIENGRQVSNSFLRVCGTVLAAVPHVSVRIETAHLLNLVALEDVALVPQIDKVLVELDSQVVRGELRNSHRSPNVLSDVGQSVLPVGSLELFLDVVSLRIRELCVQHLTRLEVTEQKHIWSKAVALQPCGVPELANKLVEDFQMTVVQARHVYMGYIPLFAFVAGK